MPQGRGPQGQRSETPSYACSFPEAPWARAHAHTAHTLVVPTLQVWAWRILEVFLLCSSVA